ncbi:MULTISPECIES: citrate synthase [unclassified Leifsonia]|uniref:citrate synthase n=1 Tax=unclassified Leifsonia TaxID=2663824 RepID=UPI0008A7AFE5|nr:MULTISPECIES: citrate synthase [unclassified Leifsonia]SEH89702.1 citrate synthase [Leifsonia sp. CL154]SFL54585.1 citrate synthase [Leifsonia sp. CL147]
MQHLVNVDRINMDALPRLTAEQTAERLGVKLETLYAYVARGRLGRERNADGSSFDPLEVERFAAGRRRRTVTGTAHSEGRPLMVIETSFALIEDGELAYRGRPVAELAGESFETVARWALTGDWDAAARFTPGAGVEVARVLADALPASAGDRDRQLVAVSAFAAADPLRASIDPAVVATAAERLVAGMVAVLPERGHADPESDTTTPDPLARRLFARLTGTAPSRADVELLNAALVVLLDHDIAVSTLAARAAASARATPYGVVIAGLGALDSPLHGNASRAAYRLLERVARGEDPARAITDTVVSTHGPVPGFGQPLYPDGDPRARILLGMLAGDERHAAVSAAVEAVSGVIGDRTGGRPNVDLALGALALALGMRDDAGEVVFATARAIGWVVHALHEYAQPPLRLRPVGRYIGP